MDATNVIALSVEITENRRLIIDLPPDTPLGTADLIIQICGQGDQPLHQAACEVARAKLAAAGKLVTDIRAPEGTIPLAPDELLRLGTLPPGSPTLDDLINEDGGAV